MRENRIHALIIQRFRNINEHTNQPKSPVIFSNWPKGGPKSKCILSSVFAVLKRNWKGSSFTWFYQQNLKIVKDGHNFAHIKFLLSVHSLFQLPANRSQAPKSTRLILFPHTAGEWRMIRILTSALWSPASAQAGSWLGRRQQFTANKGD